MPNCKYFLLGGGLAAVSAVRQLRKLDATATIVLAASEPHLPYDRPPLSKQYLRGEMDRTKLFLDPSQFYPERNPNTSTKSKVKRLEVKDRRVVLENEEIIRYEKLLIATGGRPRPLEVPGVSLQGIYYLRTIEDCEAIRTAAAPGRRALVVGAGFIGMELAASLTQRGVKVTVVEVTPSIWSRFLDSSMASFFLTYCEERGISFLTGESIAEFKGSQRVSSAVTSRGRELECDFVCIGVGILPNTEIAQAAGLKVDNGIVVDEFLQTADPDIFAAGDAASYFDSIFDKQRRVEHWGHAEYTGILAAQNMLGAKKPYDLVTYVWSDIFDLHLEFAGDETEAKEILLRGKLEDKSFTFLYLKDGILRAYFAVNTSPKEFSPLQMLIKRKADLGGKSDLLTDKGYDLKQLLG